MIQRKVCLTYTRCLQYKSKVKESQNHVKRGLNQEICIRDIEVR